MFSTKMALAAFALGALAACSHEKAAAPKAPAAEVSAAVIEVGEAEWPETFEAPGTVRAAMSATVSARVMGYINEVRVREGDRVTAGQTLVTVQARELETAREQAQAAVQEARAAIPEAEAAAASAGAQLQLAETTHRRMLELYGKRSVSAQERDESAARVEVARSAVEMARARRRQLDDKILQAEQAVEAARVQIGYLDVKAPFAGIVVSRRAEPGMLASPGVPLLEIERGGAYRLEAAAPESQLSKVRRGQAVEVRFDALPDPVRGQVEEIVPAVDPATRTFLAKIALPGNAAFRGGMFGRAVFAGGTRRVVAVPAAAVREEGQLRVVFVEERGTARARMVRLGDSRAGAWEVLSGLTAGERIVSPVPAVLRDGTKLREMAR